MDGSPEPHERSAAAPVRPSCHSGMKEPPASGGPMAGGSRGMLRLLAVGRSLGGSLLPLRLRAGGGDLLLSHLLRILRMCELRGCTLCVVH